MICSNVVCRIVVLGALAATASAADDAVALRVWGSAKMLELTVAWERGFAKANPRIRFENHMYGAVSAIAGLYTGAADIAISREIWPTEEQAFEQVTGHRVTTFEVATGSFDFPTKSSALHLFVHKDNPTGQLTMQQLRAIFGDGTIHSWKHLGWTDQPIHTYGYKADNAGALLFASRMNSAAFQWGWGFHGFGNKTLPDGGRIDAGQLILDTLRNDRFGIAISNIHYAKPGVKVVAIAAGPSGPFVVPSSMSTQDRSYPLTRSVYIFVNRIPGRQLDLNIRAFLAYVLGARGQTDLEKEGTYLPLPPRVLATQIQKLK